MNNKLVCPFCQTELEDAGIHSAGFYFWCTNCYMKQKEKNDNYTASPRIWQALIRTKKQLEIARKALEEIDTTRCIPQQTLISLGKFSKTTRFNAGNIICVATPDYIHNILEQIRHKE